MTRRPLILITNDDGVHAPGIRHLWKALSSFADLVVVAPAHEQSAVGLSITIRRPLHIEKIEWFSHEATIWSVNGTPADCVKLALNVILPRSPDLIVSGINRGANSGRNILYSGTIAGVIEGVIHGIPGIAFSVADYLQPSYSDAEEYIPSLVHYLLEHPLPSGTFLNVNFPASHPFKGIRLTTQGKQYWAENPVKREHPVEGNAYYWLGAKLAVFQEEEDSDISWLSKGYVTVVPVYIGDLTHHHHLTAHKETFALFVEQFSSISDIP